MMMRRGEMERLIFEAEEIIADSRRYLTEFGSIEPGLLDRRIRQWQNQLANARCRAAEPAK